jgi:CMP-N-acetylneuraminic acid synthetase
MPLKANSERVKGKNFREIAGKPLFKWMLDTLCGVGFIDKVIINTDAVSQLEDLGATESQKVLLRERKPELCGDFVSMNKILADDVQAVESQHYLMTHTTNPLISAATLQTAWTEYQNEIAKGFDSLFSVNKMQTRFYQADGSPINHDPNNLIRTQDLEPYFEENSCLYFFSGQSFAATKARIGKNPLLFPTPKLESVDIDGQEDWQMAEALLLYNKGKERN